MFIRDRGRSEYKAELLYLRYYWEEKSPGQKGSSSLIGNLDNFLTPDGQSALVCLDAIRGVVHIGRNVYWCKAPSRGSIKVGKVPAFFINHIRRFWNLMALICFHNNYLKTNKSTNERFGGE